MTRYEACSEAARLPRLFDFGSAPEGPVALFDRIDLRISVGVRFAGPAESFRLSGNWKRVRHNSRALTTRIPVADDDGEVFCEASLTLDFAERQPGYYETGGGACLRLNGARLLRGAMGREGLGLSLDGNTNWVGDFADLGPSDVLLHFDAIGRAVEACRERILLALPEGSELVKAEAMLLAAEACHDCTVPDAAEVVAAACRAAVAGTRHTEEEIFGRGRLSSQGAVARYRRSGGLVLKIYAKWGPSGLRVEVSSPDRNSVVAMVGERVSCELDGDEVVLRLLDPWMDRARAILSDGVGHIRELAASEATAVDLVEELSFLADFKRGQPVGGGYRPRPEARAVAGRLLRELLDFGETTLKGHRPGSQLHRLMQLGVERGVLRRDRGTSTYRLAPRFALPSLRLSRTIESVEIESRDDEVRGKNYEVK